ncbi:MAG: GH116 family glycosyl-hydrolase [Paracoccaceae bacterium]
MSEDKKPNGYFEYSGENTRHTSFPLGGIGAGSIGIGADGRLRDWEIFNKPSKGSINGFSHFAIRAARDGKTQDVRVLNGPFMGNRSGEVRGSEFNTFGFGPRREEMAGFPHFRDTSMSGPYPVAELEFRDAAFPGKVDLSAFAPFVPMEERISSMPAAFFDFKIENTSDTPMDYDLFGCIGFPLTDATVLVEKNKNGTSICGISSDGNETPKYGELCLATDHDDTTFQRNLYRGSWFDTMEVYWQDISAGGGLKDRYYEKDTTDLNKSPLANTEHSVLASHFSLAPGETKTIRYVISWFVPNVVKDWDSQYGMINEDKDMPKTWRNYYASEWNGAADVAKEALSSWDQAKSKTLALKKILADGTMPDAVIDAIASNLSIIKSATTMRLQDGTFYGWEGCHPDSGCCEGSCTHVWNYQQVLPFLFPALERTMRDADYQHNYLDSSGGMTFRLSLPIGVGIGSSRPCVDGQFGNTLKTYRDWKLTGDTVWLKKVWNQVKGAIEYAWHPENYDKWDPERSGVLTGRQHHTLDMELFGPSGWLQGFYLGALLAGSEMAKAVGDEKAATEFRDIFEKGKDWTSKNLFNGSYFVQDVDIKDKSTISDFVSKEGQTGYFDASIEGMYWSDEHGELKYQIADGCEIDQVLGQWHTELYGLEPVFEPEQFASALRAVFDQNFYPRLSDMANPCRVFGMGDESGTVMCTWPEGTERPSIPLPYAQETMHGFEYAFGTQLMMIDEFEKAFQVFAGVRDRYRGHNRNPWNEIECGSNYARSMSSYAAIIVLSGFKFDGVNGSMSFAPKVEREGTFQSLWSNGQAWGQVTISDGAVQISVLGGSLTLKTLTIGNKTFNYKELKEYGAEVIDDVSASVKSGGVINLVSKEIIIGAKYSIQK